VLSVLNIICRMLHSLAAVNLPVIKQHGALLTCDNFGMLPQGLIGTADSLIRTVDKVPGID
jgi:hypothetical protein